MASLTRSIKRGMIFVKMNKQQKKEYYVHTHTLPKYNGNAAEKKQDK